MTDQPVETQCLESLRLSVFFIKKYSQDLIENSNAWFDFTLNLFKLFSNNSNKSTTRSNIL
ncbi:MAG: hypothetical protein LBB88_00170 [Planctomycetaceae bacterium]|nr:hypothetical protein [Planctomycetaceae bacterium]